MQSEISRLQGFVFHSARASPPGGGNDQGAAKTLAGVIGTTGGHGEAQVESGPSVAASLQTFPRRAVREDTDHFFREARARTSLPLPRHPSEGHAITVAPKVLQ